MRTLLLALALSLSGCVETTAKRPARASEPPDWFCALDTLTERSYCRRERVACEDMRDGLVARGWTVNHCEGFTEAFCYSVAREPSCFSNMRGCDAERDISLSQEIDPARTPTRCRSVP